MREGCGVDSLREFLPVQITPDPRATFAVNLTDEARGSPRREVDEPLCGVDLDQRQPDAIPDIHPVLAPDNPTLHGRVQ